VVRGYEGLLDALASLPGAVVDRGSGPRVANANVVAFAYDFRRSVAEAADLLDVEVKARLDALGLAGEEKRVVVVAHSMGGLVARHWLGVGGDDGHGGPREPAWRLCRTLITLGTPHRGAPKALNVLVNGVGKGPFQFRKATDVLRAWPGVYELLPRYPAILDRLVDPLEPVTRYPYERPQLGSLAADAYRIHQTIEDAWNDMPRGGPEMVPLVGWSHRTLSAAVLDRNGLRVEKVNPEWIDLVADEVLRVGRGNVRPLLAMHDGFHLGGPSRLLRSSHQSVAFRYFAEERLGVVGRVVQSPVRRLVEVVAPHSGQSQL
jgi:pimeloyl-ACP methyl ester carboxylesterase